TFRYLNLKIPSAFFVAVLYLGYALRALKVADQLPVIMISYDGRPVNYSPQPRSASGGNEYKEDNQQISRLELHSSLNNKGRYAPLCCGLGVGGFGCCCCCCCCCCRRNRGCLGAGLALEISVYVLMTRSFCSGSRIR